MALNDEPFPRFTLVSLVIDNIPVEFDTTEDVIEYLNQLCDEHVCDLSTYLIQEWSPASTFSQQRLVNSERADIFLKTEGSAG